MRSHSNAELYSRTTEARDGMYWYLFIYQGKQAIIRFDCVYSSTITIDGNWYVEADIEKHDLNLRRSVIQKVATEGIKVLGHGNSKIIIK